MHEFGHFTFPACPKCGLPKLPEWDATQCNICFVDFLFRKPWTCPDCGGHFRGFLEGQKLDDGDPWRCDDCAVLEAVGRDFEDAMEATFNA